MADVRIKDLPVLPSPTGAEFMPSDIAPGGTRRTSIAQLAAFFLAFNAAEFVLRPGGAAGRGVFTTWADLMAAVALVPMGIPKRIYFDDQYAPCVVPAGTYGVPGDYQLVGAVAAAGNRPLVTFQDGAIFTSWPSRLARLRVDNQNSTTPLFNDGGGLRWVELDQVTHALSAGQPLFGTDTNGGVPEVYLSRTDVADGCPLVDSLAFVKSARVFVEGGSTLGSDVVSASPVAYVTVDASSRASMTQSGSASVEEQALWSSQSTFVYDPTAVAPFNANTYVDWGELHRFISQVDGYVTVVMPFDCTVKGAVYDVDRQVVRWVGGGNTGAGGTQVVATQQAGAVVSGLRQVENLHLRTVDGTSYLHSPSIATDWRYDFIDALIEPSGAADAAILHNTSGTLFVNLSGETNLALSGGAPAIRTIAGPGGALVLTTFDAATVDADVITTPALYVATLRSASPASDIAASQVNMLGTTTRVLLARSDRVKYTPTLDAGLWAASDPATAGEAIARLAVAVRGLLGFNIP